MSESFMSHGVPVSVPTRHPAGGGAHPAIVIAYGTEGMNDPFGPAIEDFAATLADNGFVALMPQYFERTGTTAGKGVFAELLASPGLIDTWTETLVDALAHAAGLGDVKADRVGLLGFSLGGHLSLRAALAPSSVKVGAVVEFFGPILPPFPALGDVGKLPPLEIHHGKADTDVWPEHSEALQASLEQAKKREGVDYTIHWYDGEVHGFKTPAAQKLSKERTVDFFQKHLK